MELLFKRVQGTNLSTIQKRGAVINYEPIIFNNYQMFQECWTLAEQLKPKLIENIKWEYEFLSERRTYEEIDEFKKTHPFWKKESESLLYDYKNLYGDLGWIYNEMFKWNERNRTSKNNVACKENACLSYFQIYDDKLYVVSRSLDIACGFKADVLTIKYIADIFECKDICWIVVAPHHYVENILDGEPKTYEDLLKMKPVLKVRKGVK